MNKINTYLPFIASALFMCIVLVIIYPYYQYYIDPDGTAYLTIAKRYATGDYQMAINGYWSPWSCWLVAILLKAGFTIMSSSILINTLGAACLLWITQSYFIRFHIGRYLQWILQLSLSLFLCYAVFWQLFDDLWECFFLLSALRLIISEQFNRKPLLWIITGVVGALAYFAKAYAFPFFIINTIACSFITDREKWIKISVTVIAVMLLCAIPWIWLLHNKYGIWTTSTAGSLNMSWYLVGHPYFKDNVVLLSPLYPNSPSYWEDPYLINGAAPHFWNSFHLLGLQAVRIVYTLLKFVNSMNELSAFFTVIWLIVVLITFSQKIRRHFPGNILPIALSFLLFPLGYLLINFESRYLWYLLPLSMLIGALIIQQLISHLERRWLKNMVVIVFTVSYLIYPVWKMKEMMNVGNDDYKIATALKQHGIQGSFTSLAASGLPAQRLQRIAYFSGNAYYNAPFTDASQNDLFKDINRYQVKYYFYLCDNNMDSTFMLRNKSGISYPEITDNSIPGIRVFQLNR